MSMEELQAFLQAEQQKQIEAAQAVAEQSAKAGELFLMEYEKKEGVKKTKNGILYMEIETGEGEMPSLTDTVKVHYQGTLKDGTEFDSSYARGEPAEFPVNGVISGWTEALQLMQEGDKWRLFVPSNLAYGERGVGPIPGNTVLIFDVELITVK